MYQRNAALFVSFLIIGCSPVATTDPTSTPKPASTPVSAASGSTAQSMCGNEKIEGAEACDGRDLAEKSCASFGFDSGALACARSCDRFDISACSGGACEPDCKGRECGNDSVCGESCGTCDTGSTCNASGNCEEPQLNTHAPKILDFTASKITIGEGGSMVLTVVVTDPDGIDDLIGGQIKDSLGHTYGAFATSAQEGAYTTTLSWSEINTVQALDGYAGSDTRTLVARFYDQVGLVTEKTLLISFRCEAGNFLCAGACGAVIDTSDEFQQTSSNNDHCGACGNKCQGGTTCFNGTCIPYKVEANATLTEYCNDVCAALGRYCMDAQVEYVYSTCGLSNTYACSQTPPANKGSNGIYYCDGHGFSGTEVEWSSTVCTCRTPL